MAFQGDFLVEGRKRKPGLWNEFLLPMVAEEDPSRKAGDCTRASGDVGSYSKRQAVFQKGGSSGLHLKGPK